jgi:hypothetical protein
MAAATAAAHEAAAHIESVAGPAEAGQSGVAGGTAAPSGEAGALSLQPSPAHSPEEQEVPEAPQRRLSALVADDHPLNLRLGEAPDGAQRLRSHSRVEWRRCTGRTQGLLRRRPRRHDAAAGRVRARHADADSVWAGGGGGIPRVGARRAPGLPRATAHRAHRQRARRARCRMQSCRVRVHRAACCQGPHHSFARRPRHSPRHGPDTQTWPRHGPDAPDMAQTRGPGPGTDDPDDAQTTPRRRPDMAQTWPRRPRRWPRRPRHWPRRYGE